MHAIFEISYNEALKIQRAQLAYYRQSLGLRGTRMIRHATRPCPANLHPDEETSIFEINGLIPRGGSIEYIARLCQGPIKTGEQIQYLSTRPYGRKIPEECSLRGAVHDAIRRGLM
jgi:hypothetical protein